MADREYFLEKVLSQESYTNAVEALLSEDDALSPREIRDASDKYKDTDREIITVQNDLKNLEDKGVVRESSFNEYTLTSYGRELGEQIFGDHTVDNLLNGGSDRL